MVEPRLYNCGFNREKGGEQNGGRKISTDKRDSATEWKWHRIVQNLGIKKVENICFHPRSSTTKTVLGGNLDWYVDLANS